MGVKYLAKISDEGAQANCFASTFSDLLYFHFSEPASLKNASGSFAYLAAPDFKIYFFNSNMFGLITTSCPGINKTQSSVIAESTTELSRLTLFSRKSNLKSIEETLASSRQTVISLVLVSPQRS